MEANRRRYQGVNIWQYEKRKESYFRKKNYCRSSTLPIKDSPPAISTKTRGLCDILSSKAWNFLPLNHSQRTLASMVRHFS
jgi:hypothetical protein